MIFAEDMLEAVLAGTKTQTRRRFKGGERRCRYIPGRDYAVQAKRGGFAVARILIVGVSAVPCFDISRADARAEGFPSPDAFHERWRLMHGSLSGWCWRIEFRLGHARVSPRIVIYPLFGAGHDETVELCEKLADVMLAHHGPSSGDEIKSFIVFENADDLPEDPEELVKGAIEDAALVILVGAEDEETERDKEPFA